VNGWNECWLVKWFKRKFTPMKSYGFRLRFKTPPGRKFKSDDENLSFSLPGSDQGLTIAYLNNEEEKLPTDPEEYSIKGSGFSSEESARHAGQLLKQALIVIGADQSLGLDVGKDTIRSALAKAVREKIQKETGYQIRNNIDGLDVYPDHPPVQHFAMSMRGSVSREITTLEDLLNKSFSDIPVSPKQFLALEILNLTHFEPNSKTKFLSLVTVVEILSTRNPMPSELIEQIEGCIELVKTSPISSDQKQTLKNGLSNLKIVSIKKSCIQLVSNILDEAEANFFADCYNARSQLVHDGDSKIDIAPLMERLNTLVKDLVLTHIQVSREKD